MLFKAFFTDGHKYNFFSIFFASFVRFGKIRHGGRPQKFLIGSAFCEYQRGVPRTLLNGVHNFEVFSALLSDLGENLYQTSSTKCCSALVS